MEKNNSTLIDQLLPILKEGEELGLDLQDTYQKIEQIKNTTDDRIKIALLSSFSDGKTSIIAGLNGRVENNMKIDIDESSDEINIYRPHGLASDFEIMDTPGLFGTKTQEIKGVSVRLSEKTEKYISEAHIIIYVCDAVTLLKDSHAAFIDKVMRHWGKLENTIFVINKMDETGCLISDEEDFRQTAELKKSELIKRLKDTIRLTKEEENKLNIVCIAANPHNKGFDYWFANIEKYRQRSHIEDLRKCILQITSKSNKIALRQSQNISTYKDINDRVVLCVGEAGNVLSKNISVLDNLIHDNEQDISLLHTELENKRKDMQNQLIGLQKEINSRISGVSMEDFESVLRDEIGMTSEGVTCYIVQSKIDDICGGENQDKVQTAALEIEKRSTVASNLMQKGLNFGTDYLKNVSISGEQIKSIRNIVASNYKFAPWGAIKMGSKVTAGLNYAGHGLEIVLDVLRECKQAKEQKEFEDEKRKLMNVISDGISKLLAASGSFEEYIHNFVPSYNALCDELKKQKEEKERLQGNKEKLNNFQQHIVEWMKKNAEDVSFAEIK